jgi:cytochrome P450
MKSLPPVVRRPAHWLLGPAYYAQRAPLEWIPRWIQEYGDVFSIKSPLGRAIILARPEWARHVLVDGYQHYQRKSRSYEVLRILFGNGLVTSEGEFWRGQRKLIQPAFHRQRLDRLFSMMVDQAAECVGRLAQAARSGKAIDLGPVLSHLTLDIISKAMFSTDVEGSASEVSRHIATLNEFALRMLRRPWLFFLPRRFPTPFHHRQVRALASLNHIVLDIIQTRRRHPGRHDDLLAMLLSACEEETGRGMSDAQLRDEVMTIFVAGHETTANAMCWLLYLVSQHLEAEEQLLAEVDSQWPGTGFSVNEAGRFDYAHRVIDESLRLFPSIWSVGRQCTEADQMGGFHVPPGMNVVIPIFHFHWSERFWPEPRRFDPDRFLPSRRPKPEQMIYFPFGAGPRGCIGNHFALQELLIFTVLFFRHFTFRLEPGFAVEPDPLITLRPKHGMRMILHARRPVAAASVPA